MNFTKLVGRISDYELSHTLNENKFYKGNINVTRTSGVVDKIPFEVKDNIIGIENIQNDIELTLLGELRSYVKNEPYLKVKLYITKISTNTDSATNNEVKLDGYLTREANSHTSKFGSPITNCMIKHVKIFGQANHMKKYNIPVVAFHDAADTLKNLHPKDHIEVVGRLQSRLFDKVLENGEIEQREICEIAIKNLEVDGTQYDGDL